MFVFGVICHALTNPLIYTISKLCAYEYNIVIIHVDKKTNSTDYFKMVDKFSCYSNVVFVDNERIDVRWGGVSQIHVMLILMKKSLEYKFKYFSFISGDDIPIVKINIMREMLLSAYEKKIQFIGLCRKHDAYSRVKFKYPDYFFNKKNNLWVRLKKYLYLNFFKQNNRVDYNFPDLYKGSNWFTITDDLISYIVRYVDNNPEYLRAFNSSLCADEVFFHTIVMNSGYGKNVYGIDAGLDDCQMSLRYIDWVSGPEYPKVLDIKDLSKIIKSEGIFARKISSKIDLEGIDSMYSRITEHFSKF